MATYEILYFGRVEAIITETTDESYLAKLLLNALKEEPTDYGTKGAGWQIREKGGN